MKKQPEKKQGIPEGRSYGRDDAESKAAALGGATPGFKEDWEFKQYEKRGVGFKTLAEVLDVDGEDGSGSSSPNISAKDADEGRSMEGIADRSLKDPNDPDIMDFGEQDLRIGGEEVSGVSEYSLRAHHPELDDGIDVGNFQKSDEEILSNVIEFCVDNGIDSDTIDCSVKGAEVTLRGKLADSDTKELLELSVKRMPGVREVVSYLE